MSSFSLHIATDTAAFGTDDACPELARILRATADKIERAGTTDGTTVRDINGNTCGRFFWTERYATHDDAAALDLIENEITTNENFAPKAMTELLERIVDRMRLTGRDNADTFPDYEDEPAPADLIRCPRCNAEHTVASTDEHARLHCYPPDDGMRAAMNREPDPSTDEGYGPRAVND